jgi:CheY-like chemotaxis protein
MQAQTAKTNTKFCRADGSPRRVLYAEDQASSRVVTTAMLERMGFCVHAVEDGELALDAARSDNFDVILLDIEMPVMDGVTAARSIRAELEHCAGTPILALSAFLADSTEHTIWRDAFDSALPKPANGNELRRAMVEALAHKDAKTIVVPAKPTGADIVTALRGGLPTGVWAKLVETAAEEMRHLANSLFAALESRDYDTADICSCGLKGLALNFGATKVAVLAEDISVTHRNRIFVEIDTWQSEV